MIFHLNFNFTNYLWIHTFFFSKYFVILTQSYELMNNYIVVFKQKTGLIVNKHYFIVSKQNFFISIVIVY